MIMAKGRTIILLFLFAYMKIESRFPLWLVFHVLACLPEYRIHTYKENHKEIHINLIFNGFFKEH